MGEADPSLWGGVGRSCQTRGEDLVSVPSNSMNMYFVYCTFDKDKL